MGPETKTDAFATRGEPQPVPHCFQFRAFALDRLYPVTGYCDLGVQPRRFMIPSVELYRAHCSSGNFETCPWHRADSGEVCA